MSFWLLLSVAIGFFGHETKLGFFGFFLLSVVFSPLVGLVVLYFFRKEDVHELIEKGKKKADGDAEAEPAAA